MDNSQYREWLKKKLKEQKITDAHISALCIVLERAIQREATRLSGHWTRKPFYKLYRVDKKGNRKPNKTWRYMAEAALWIKYKNLPAYNYFRSLCYLPDIRKRLKNGRRVSIDRFAPSTRLSAKLVRAYEAHYQDWARKNAA